jgi:hypothetical protein
MVGSVCCINASHGVWRWNPQPIMAVTVDARLDAVVIQRLMRLCVANCKELFKPSR